jgi:hypothetical protein
MPVYQYQFTGDNLLLYFLPGVYIRYLRLYTTRLTWRASVSCLRGSLVIFPLSLLVRALTHECSVERLELQAF